MLEVYLSYAVLGCIGGLLAGMLGIGGGVVIVPALAIILGWQDFPADQLMVTAVATSLATIIFTSISATRAQIRRGAVDWTLFRRWAPVVVLGSFFSGFIAEQLPPQVFQIAIAGFLLLVALIMLSKWLPDPGRQMPGATGTSLLGLASGTVSGLAGIGGGNVMVPLMVFYNVPMQRAAATASALGLPLASVGAAGYVIAGWDAGVGEASLGYVYLPAAGLIALFTVLLAPVGVSIGHRLPAAQLKRCFGAVLLVVAGRMLATSLF